MSKAIYWFRNNLRLHDNPSMHQAMKENDEVYPVFILPTNESSYKKLGWSAYGKWRKKFLIEALNILDDQIQNLGGKLTILQGDPPEVLAEIAQNLQVTKIYASKEVGYNEVLEEINLPSDFELTLREDQFLISPEELPFNIDKLPFGFSAFRKKVEKHWVCRQVSECTDWKFGRLDIESVSLQIIKDELHPNSAHPFLGGESEGLSHLENYIFSSLQIKSYKFTRNQLIGKSFSSKLSGFLALGCLSPVKIYQDILRFENEIHQNVSTYWLKFELLWKEFFRYTSLRHGQLSFQIGGIQQKSATWSEDLDLLQKWIDGETSDDFVNANMIELKETGFMSNRGRQNAASYLVHDLGVDWRLGAWYFEKMLVDYDVASNWGNWMYVAGVGNDRRNHKFDTKWQAENYDPKGEFRRLWLDN